MDTYCIPTNQFFNIIKNTLKYVEMEYLYTRSYKL